MDYRTRRLVNGVIAVCALAIVSTIVIALLARRTEGVDFTVLFKDAKGLPVGAPVMLQGLRVGEVKRVELAEDKQHIEVDIAIFPRYAGEIPAPPGITARIKKGMLLPGNYSVVLVKQKNAAGEMPEGAKIEGVESWASEKKFEAKGAFKRTYEAAVEKTSGKIDQIKAWWAKRGEEKERKKIREQMNDWLEKVEEINVDTPPVAIKALRAQAKLLADEWRSEGFDEEAKQIEDTAAALEEFEHD